MLTYRDGLKLPGVMCHRCGAKKPATVRREGPRWALHLKCGHVKTAGWTMPPDELRRRGLVETETPVDPRALAAQKQRHEDRLRAEEDWAKFQQHRRDFTRSKYL